MAPRFGIVLTGGGARAAYQVGVLQALAEILPTRAPQFEVISGTSAGAINAAYLAANAAEWKRAVDGLATLWKNLQPERIYRTDTLSLGKIGARWLMATALGGRGQGQPANYLLDTAPLGRLIEAEVSFEQLHRNCETGLLHGVALTTSNYYSGTSVVFYEGHASIEDWARSSRMSIRTRFGPQHVLASSAIPIFFPPVRVGDSFHGDGCIRQSTPLSPAIHMGADRIVAIGIRHPRAHTRAVELSLATQLEPPKMAQILGMVLNSVFLDSLEADIERLTRINQTLSKIPADLLGTHFPNLRSIPVLMLRPSSDLGALAGRLLKHFPGTLQYLLRGLGASREEGADLMSYLAFDDAFTQPLVELGYEDTLARRGEIRHFFEDEAPGPLVQP